jgi:hypothetical protein
MSIFATFFVKFQFEVVRHLISSVAILFRYMNRFGFKQRFIQKNIETSLQSDLYVIQLFKSLKTAVLKFTHSENVCN